jgi:DNA-binding MarR family transcriptional regulator
MYNSNRVPGQNTISDWTVGKYGRMFVLSRKQADILIVLESEGDISGDDDIAILLSEEPLPSGRQIAKKVMMSKSIVYRHLTQTMRWKLRHLN